MKAMILAAGRGTRVRPLTHELPKPMIPIMGKPVMEFLVEELSRHGFNQIMVNTAHLAAGIENYFGDGRRWGVEIGYSFEGHLEEGELKALPVGSAGGLKRIQKFSGFFDDTFLVVCGDALIDLDLTTAVRQHWQSGAVASLVVDEVPHHRVSHYGVVVCDSEGRVTSFQEKPAEDEALSNQVNSGIYIFEPEILELIPDEVEFDIGSELIPLILARGLHMNAVRLPFNWIDIGQLSDYWNANQQLMQGQLRDVPMPGEEVLPGVWVGLNVDIDWENIQIEGPVYIGASCHIEAGCEIQGPTWIAHGCHLKSGARISRSILFEYSRIGGSGVVNESVVFGRNCVDKEGNPVQTEEMELDWVGDARDTEPAPAKAVLK
ncbi:MAG: NDP-sugar synthase [Arenicellales bacterium]|nr:NDP-sugar synthase [Arenicellales bacterium]MDP7521552.1 NDP-sugar synthase [Arenicellales bacterium]